MPKTLSMIWLHIIWSTKDREPLIRKYFRGELNNFLKEYSIKKGIHLDIVNGVEDHIHLLVRISTVQNVADVVALLKGASSRWINENYYPSGKFRWQQGYGVFSVGRKDIKSVRKYIFNQEKHHKETSYSSEIKKLSKQPVL